MSMFDFCHHPATSGIGFCNVKIKTKPSNHLFGAVKLRGFGHVTNVSNGPTTTLTCKWTCHHARDIAGWLVGYIYMILNKYTSGCHMWKCSYVHTHAVYSSKARIYQADATTSWPSHKIQSPQPSTDCALTCWTQARKLACRTSMSS